MISEQQARKYCADDISKIENYDQAVGSPNKWDCHHRKEINDDGTTTPVAALVAAGLYYKRPASELVFLEAGHHRRLHIAADGERGGRISRSKTGVKFSAEHRRNIGLSRTGIKLSESVRSKMAASHTGVKMSQYQKERQAASLALQNRAYREYKANRGTYSWNDWQRLVWKTRDGNPRDPGDLTQQEAREVMQELGVAP